MSAGIEIAILGVGRLAEVLIDLLASVPSSPLKLRVWGRSEARLAEIKARQSSVETSSELAPVVSSAEVVIFAVPANALLEVADRYGPFARGDQIVLHAARGVGPGFMLPHQMIRARTCARKIAALGGPLHGREMHLGRTVVAVVASRFGEARNLVTELVRGTPVQIHASTDVVGVEVSGAISNVSAVAAGLADGLELGETARGFLLAEGLGEAQRLGVALGADPGTFVGLAGIGDLIPRRVTSTERNQNAGVMLARGHTAAELRAELSGALEGLDTAEWAAARAEGLGLRLPLVRAVADVIAGKSEPRAALEQILRGELEGLAWLRPNATGRAE